MGPINFPIPRSVYQQTPEARQTAAANAGVVPAGQKSTIPNKLPQAAPTNALPSWASQSNLINQLVGGAGGDLAANPTVGTQTTAPNVAVPNDARKTQTPDFRTNQADAGSKLAGGGGAFRTARVSSAALANVAPALADSPDLNMDVAGNEAGTTNGYSDAIANGLANKKEAVTGQTEEQRAAAEAAARAATRGDRGSAGSTEQYEQDQADPEGAAARQEDEKLANLQADADRLGISPEELDALLTSEGVVASQVMVKNGKLYRRIGENDWGEISEETQNLMNAAKGKSGSRDRDAALAELRKLAETEAPGMDPQVIQDLLTASDSRRSLEQSKAISLAMRLGQDPETMQAQSAGINQEFGVAGMEEASKIKMQAEVQNLQSAMREYDAKLSAINQSAALFAGSAQAQEMAKIQADLLAKRSAAEKEMMKYQMQLQQQQAPGFGEILGGIGLGILGGGLNALTGGIFGGLEDKISTKLWG